MTIGDSIQTGRRRKPSAPKLRERDIAGAIVGFLELDGWRPIKMEPISRREWGKGTGEVGQADYLFVRYLANPCSTRGCSGENCTVEAKSRAQAMWLEMKRPDGKVSDKQREWHVLERARGALTLIAGEDFGADVDSFIAWYRQSGLLRRKGL